MFYEYEYFSNTVQFPHIKYYFNWSMIYLNNSFYCLVSVKIKSSRLVVWELNITISYINISIIHSIAGFLHTISCQNLEHQHKKCINLLNSNQIFVHETIQLSSSSKKSGWKTNCYIFLYILLTLSSIDILIFEPIYHRRDFLL